MAVDHIHQWKPVSPGVDVLVNEKCVFVCECGVFKTQRMREYNNKIGYLNRLVR